jgi:hypothetical protein
MTKLQASPLRCMECAPAIAFDLPIEPAQTDLRGGTEAE